MFVPSYSEEYPVASVVNCEIRTSPSKVPVNKVDFLVLALRELNYNHYIMELYGSE